MKLTKVFFVCICFLFSTVYAQNNETQSKSVEFGFLIEVSMINSNMKYLNIDKNDETNIDTRPLSLFLSGRAYFTDNFSFEFRPGIILVGEYYTGIEYGFFLRYYFENSKFYVISGINYHNNMADAHGLSHYVEITGNTATLINFSVGYHISDNLGFLLSYYHPLKDYKIYHGADLIDDPIFEIYDVNLTNIFQVGFDYTF